MSDIDFIGLHSQKLRLGDSVSVAIGRVLEHGDYIFGPEVKLLEQSLCDFWRADYCLGCSNGTDALRLALLSESIGVGDVVIVPSFSFIASHEAPILQGAELFFCDVDIGSYVVSVDIMRVSIESALSRGLNVRAFITVDLFGMPVDYISFRALADEYGLVWISDSAQSFGSFYGGVSAAQYADYVCVSFFPTKVLGCYGDGGAIFCRSSVMDERLRSLAFHGIGGGEHIYVGDNIRIGSIQAAVLLEKLRIFGDELVSRRRLASIYSQKLGNFCHVPDVGDGIDSVWAHYSIVCEGRDGLRDYLSGEGIPTRIYYERPAHRHLPYVGYGFSDLSNTDSLSSSIISLSLHPYLSDEHQSFIIEHVISFFRS